MIRLHLCESQKADYTHLNHQARIKTNNKAFHTNPFKRNQPQRWDFQLFSQGSATPRTTSRPRPKGTNGLCGDLCDELRLQQNPPAETHEEISDRQQNFHPTLPSQADPGAIVGENNCRRHPDPVGMLKCRPESKMCVRSGCVRRIIFLAE